MGADLPSHIQVERNRHGSVDLRQPRHDRRTRPVGLPTGRRGARFRCVEILGNRTPRDPDPNERRMGTVGWRPRRVHGSRQYGWLRPGRCNVDRRRQLLSYCGIPAPHRRKIPRRPRRIRPIMGLGGLQLSDEERPMGSFRVGARRSVGDAADYRRSGDRPALGSVGGSRGGSERDQHRQHTRRSASLDR